MFTVNGWTDAIKATVEKKGGKVALTFVVVGKRYLWLSYEFDIFFFILSTCSHHSVFFPRHGSVKQIIISSFNELLNCLTVKATERGTAVVVLLLTARWSMPRGMISIFKAMLLFKAVRQLIVFCQSNILIISVFLSSSFGALYRSPWWDIQVRSAKVSQSPVSF